jgi:hypothetical protein
MNKSEHEMGCKRVVNVDKASNLINLVRPAQDGKIHPDKDFTYDAVYDVDS